MEREVGQCCTLNRPDSLLDFCGRCLVTVFHWVYESDAEHLHINESPAELN